MKDVKKRWKDAKGREPDENDVEEIFKVRNQFCGQQQNYTHKEILILKRQLKILVY